MEYLPLLSETEEERPLQVVFTDDSGRKIPVKAHDADTYYDAKGKGYRDVGFNAAETIKLTPTGGIAVGSKMGELQSKLAQELTNQYGFTNIKKQGTDIFNRDLVKRTNGSQGIDDFLIANGIIKPNQNTTRAQMDALTFQELDSALNPASDNTPVGKARALVNNLLREGTTIVRPMLNTAEEYQDWKSATSNKGLGQQSETIKFMEDRLKSPNLLASDRPALVKQLAATREAYQRNLNLPTDLYLGSVQGQNEGRSTEFGRAGRIGLLGLKDSLANFKEYFGDLVGSNTLQEAGKNDTKDNDRERKLIDVSAGDRDPTGGTTTNLGNVDVKSISSLARFVANTGLQYGPQMATMVAGSVLLAPVGAAVAGTAGAVAFGSLVPAGMAIADVYGEMPDKEKSVMLASFTGLAIGLVDKFSFSRNAIVARDLVHAAGIENIAKKIALSKNITTDAAKQLLSKELYTMGKDYATVVTAFAGEQLMAKRGLTDLLGNIAKHSGIEGGTELIQEVMQYGAVTAGSSNDFNWKTLYDRAKEAAIVGGMLGGVMHTVPGMYDNSKFNQELNMASGVETKARTANSTMEEEERKRNGGIKLSDIDVAARLMGSQTTMNPDDLQSMILDKNDMPTMAKNAAGLVESGGLFSQSRDNLMRPFVNFPGGRMIAGLLDANSVRGVYSGMSAFKRIHMITNSVMSALPGSRTKFELFGTDNPARIGETLLSSLAGVPHAGATRYRLVLDEIAQHLSNQLFNLGPNVQWNISDISQPDFFLKNQIVDPVLVAANEKEFLDALVGQQKAANALSFDPNANIDVAAFQALIDRVKENFTHMELTELKALGVLENPLFNKFKSKDVDNNVAKMVGMISRSAVRKAMFGSKGEVLAKGVQMMVDAGEISPQEASKLAAGLQDQLDAFDGRHHKSDSPTRKWVEDNMTFVTMLTYMDTSLFANLGEIVFGSLGLGPKDMVRYFGKVAKTFSQDVFSKGTQLAGKITGGAVRGREEGDNSKMIREAEFTGHLGRMNDIAFNIGANLNTQSKMNMSRLMFKINLVESATNAARAARASIASDEITKLVGALANMPKDTNNDTSRWIRDRLSYYRMDPDVLVDLYNNIGTLSFDTIEQLPTDSGLVLQAKEAMLPGIINFVDEFASRPEPGSTAKLFDDQRFRLFTQFQKFTWHFSSNVIPQLWNMYLKRGPAEYSYSAFSALMLSFAVAYAGMYMKAAMRGDEEDGDDERILSKRLGQAFSYSVGQAPASLYDQVSRVTDKRADGTYRTNMLEDLANLSPSISLLRNTARDAYGIATKENDDAEKKRLIQRIPFFGEIPAARHHFDKKE